MTSRKLLLTLMLTLTLALALGACGRTTPFTPAPPTPTPIAIMPPPASPIPTEGTSARRPSLGEPFSVGVGQTAYVDLPGQQGAASALALTFERVTSDSRCPRLVACVVAGDAALVVTARLDERPPESLELHTSPPQGGPALAYGVYTVAVAALAPLADQPGDQVDPGAYQAKLVVTQEAPDGPPPGPTPAPSPVGQTAPRATVDACSLVEPADVAERFGQLAGVPRPEATPSGDGHQCAFAAANGTVTLAWYPGGADRARALVAELRAGEAAIATEDASPNGFEASVQTAGGLALVREFGGAVVVAAVRFDPQAQGVDRDGARDDLEILQLLAITRYAAGDTRELGAP